MTSHTKTKYGAVIAGAIAIGAVLCELLQSVLD